METIDRIPVTLDPAAVAKRLRHNPARASSVDLDELLALAGSLIRLCAAYEVSYTGAKGEDTVEVAGVTFRSRILRRNLDQAQKVFPFIMTAGPALEAAASASGDLLKQYYLEEMANIALENGALWLSERLKTRFGFPGLASMDPGSLEDWPITEQPKLFSIFGDTEGSSACASRTACSCSRGNPFRESFSPPRKGSCPASSATGISARPVARHTTK